MERAGLWFGSWFLVICLKKNTVSSAAQFIKDTAMFYSRRDLFYSLFWILLMSILAYAPFPVEKPVEKPESHKGLRSSSLFQSEDFFQVAITTYWLNRRWSTLISHQMRKIGRSNQLKHSHSNNFGYLDPNSQFLACPIRKKMPGWGGNSNPPPSTLSCTHKSSRSPFKIPNFLFQKEYGDLSFLIKNL